MTPPNKAKSQGKLPSSKTTASSTLPQPFLRGPDSLSTLCETLDQSHIYILHLDTKPASFKRRIFSVPVLLNIAIVALFIWRVWYITPYYLDLLIAFASGQQPQNSANAVSANDTPWRTLAWIILRRTLTFAIDGALMMFLWPWPVEFVIGRKATTGEREDGSPVFWRWAVGFRDEEIYVRRSRPVWDKEFLEGDGVVASPAKTNLLLSYVVPATSRLVLEDKTGYLLMNGDWDLDWAAMVRAHQLVDRGMVKMEMFKRPVVLIHDKEHGWMTLDQDALRSVGGEGSDEKRSPEEDARRMEVFAFRDALSKLGKEDLFYRWIEIVQFEASQPGGFGAEKQVEVARQIRELFAKEGIDFDEFWKDAVGSEVEEIS